MPEVNRFNGHLYYYGYANGNYNLIQKKFKADNKQDFSDSEEENLLEDKKINKTQPNWNLHFPSPNQPETVERPDVIVVYIDTEIVSIDDRLNHIRQFIICPLETNNHSVPPIMLISDVSVLTTSTTVATSLNGYNCSLHPIASAKNNEENIPMRIFSNAILSVAAEKIDAFVQPQLQVSETSKNKISCPSLQLAAGYALVGMIAGVLVGTVVGLVTLNPAAAIGFALVTFAAVTALSAAAHGLFKCCEKPAVENNSAIEMTNIGWAPPHFR